MWPGAGRWSNDIGNKLCVHCVSAVKSGFSLDFYMEIVISISTDGGSYRGNTAGSGPVNRGSNPRPPAINSVDSREKTVISGELGIWTVLTAYSLLLTAF